MIWERLRMENISNIQIISHGENFEYVCILEQVPNLAGKTIIFLGSRKINQLN